MARLSGVDLRKWYGQREVVRGVSPEVNQGEIVGLLGPNGAGQNHFVLYADRDHQTVFRAGSP